MSLRPFLLFSLLVLSGGLGRSEAAKRPEAILLVVGDQHSAYERTAQFVARVDRVRAENPGVPVAVAINGDSLEYGNVVARRTAGAVDFAMFAALARRVPTVLNLGNHEPEFHDVPETVRRLREAGLIVISGNLRDRGTGQPFAPATATLALGPHRLTVVGVTTDRLATFRVAIRPQLDLADPVVWARENLSTLLRDGPLSVVLSHAGLRADRAILPLLPDGTLFAGAHDHLRFVHEAGRTVYFHSGSWMDYVSVARLERAAGGLRWRVSQEPLDEAPADAALAELVRTTLAQHLTPEETAVVGRSPRALGPAEAARFAVEAARAAVGADAAMVGGTTFGAGLPAGAVSRFAFDACVRFDGPLFVGEVDGAWLQQLLARSNQGPETPFATRGGENLVAVGPAAIDPARRYRFVTSDWAAKNARTYFGENPPTLAENPVGLRLKAAVLAALQR
jgi:2',3'-cyclic-nucleotide 2'-phosphodiesterase (5'-nucleotidase family)